jgi:hypothetical protein
MIIIRQMLDLTVMPPPFPQAAGEVKSMSRFAARRTPSRSEFPYRFVGGEALAASPTAERRLLTAL